MNPSWTDLARAVRIKTAYIASIVLLLGTALTGVSFATSGTPQTMMLALGSTLVTSSVFSVVTEATLRLDILDEFRDELEPIRNEVRRLIPGDDHAGFRLYENRRDIDFNTFAKEAHGAIRACGFSVNDFLTASNMDHLYQGIVDGRITHIQILLLDPSSDAALMRSKHPAYRHSESLLNKNVAVSTEIRDLVTRLKAAGLSDVFHFRYSPEPITVSMVADEKITFVTPVVRTRTGGTSPTIAFHCRPDGMAYYEAYREHFDSLFEGGHEQSVS